MGANFGSTGAAPSPPPTGANLVARNIVEGMIGGPITNPTAASPTPISPIGAGGVPSPFASAIGSIPAPSNAAKRSLLG